MTSSLSLFFCSPKPSFSTNVKKFFSTFKPRTEKSKKCHIYIQDCKKRHFCGFKLQRDPAGTPFYFLKNKRNKVRALLVASSSLRGRPDPRRCSCVQCRLCRKTKPTNGFLFSPLCTFPCSKCAEILSKIVFHALKLFDVQKPPDFWAFNIVSVLPQSTQTNPNVLWDFRVELHCPLAGNLLANKLKILIL